MPYDRGNSPLNTRTRILLVINAAQIKQLVLRVLNNRGNIFFFKSKALVKIVIVNNLHIITYHQSQSKKGRNFAFVTH